MTSTKWIALVAVILMLVSMMMYIGSDDEAIVPDDPGQNLPAPAQTVTP